MTAEVFDPRTLYPFDWPGLAASLDKTGRLVVIDDANRFCGLAAEIMATAAEEMHLVAAPKRVTRPDSAVLGCVTELDLTLQPNPQQLAAAIYEVVAGDGRRRGWPHPAELASDGAGHGRSG